MVSCSYHTTMSISLRDLIVHQQPLFESNFQPFFLLFFFLVAFFFARNFFFCFQRKRMKAYFYLTETAFCSCWYSICIFTPAHISCTTFVSLLSSSRYTFSFLSCGVIREPKHWPSHSNLSSDSFNNLFFFEEKIKRRKKLNVERYSSIAISLMLKVLR